MKKLFVASMIATAGLMAMTGCAVTSGQSSVGEYVDDATVATRVKTKFATDPGVSAARIQVEVQDGTVQLAGFATSEAERAKAAELAREVPGAKSVRNNIIVKPADK
ncbi:BON domain-containing protein [Eleftheria terrae]|uniref:BON domain-containing protein n=1 Tax=Eleftheria terrae TaxID=1597781 RepID=UPI00263B2096|nr:BON domain-containing protein [Eleftheria terrae]WKB54251.1 BON domain-containing protein [Eleftheria terrae]